MEGDIGMKSDSEPIGKEPAAPPAHRASHGMEPVNVPSMAEDDEPARRSVSAEAILQALPIAVYATDASGRITFHNQAASTLWGVQQASDRKRYCGAWKLHRPDGAPLDHAQSPLAVALREQSPRHGCEIVIEQPDGTRVPVITHPTPLFDGAGQLVGAVDIMIDVSDRLIADLNAQRYAAIVESSDDAILAKDLNGTIVSWNQGAERLFGYSADETIGRPVSILIPAHLQNEEPRILSRIRAGERVDHFETIRRRKDGSFVEISLTVSPVKNGSGQIVGASKIARDITERRRTEERQRLLLREMDHRVKNLFALASGLVTLSARSAKSADDLARTLRERLSALARAHALTVPVVMFDKGEQAKPGTTLHTLLATILAPYDNADAGGPPQARVSGDDTVITGDAVTNFALLLHEFASNATKYGALSIPEGYVTITTRLAPETLHVTWTERGGPPIGGSAMRNGFGSTLIDATIKGQLNGEIVRDWRPEGLAIQLTIARDRLDA